MLHKENTEGAVLMVNQNVFCLNMIFGWVLTARKAANCPIHL